MKTLAAAVALTAALGIAGGKDREWLDGTLLDPVLNHFFENAAQKNSAAKQNINGFDYQQNSSTTQTVTDTYVIETTDVVYLVERVRLASVKPPALVRYHPIKFAIEKNKLILRDEAGKEFDVKIVKLVQKEPATQIEAKSTP